MKKFAIIFACLIFLLNISNAFSDVKVAALPQIPYNGKDYVATIVAATYTVNHKGKPSILISTLSDDENNQSGLPGLAIKIDGHDLPFGLTLANSVGKKLAVMFMNAKYQINVVQIITDEYWKRALTVN